MKRNYYILNLILASFINVNGSNKRGREDISREEILRIGIVNNTGELTDKKGKPVKSKPSDKTTEFFLESHTKDTESDPYDAADSKQTPILDTLPMILQESCDKEDTKAQKDAYFSLFEHYLDNVSPLQFGEELGAEFRFKYPKEPKTRM